MQKNLKCLILILLFAVLFAIGITFSIVVVSADDLTAKIEFLVSSEPAKPGDTVRLEISVSGTTPISGLLLYNLQYDTNALEFVSFDNYGDLVYSSLGRENSIGSSIINLGYSPNIVPNGYICSASFIVKEDAEEGEYPISFTVGASDNGVIVSSSINNGVVTVRQWVNGDFDENGIVDMKDVVHFIGWVNFSFFDGLYPMVYNGDKDFNNDGIISMLDAVYFMGWVNFSYISDLYEICWSSRDHVLTFVEGISAECEKDGNISYWICEKCGKCYIDQFAKNKILPKDTVIPALGHDIESSYTSNELQHWHKCSRCGAEFDLENHKWDKGVVVTASTTTTYGLIEYTCIICGATRNDVIPPIDPDSRVWDGSVADSFDGGCGTAYDPYQIATPAQWAYFAQRNNYEHPTGEYYVLTADLYFNEGDASIWGTIAPANNLANYVVGNNPSMNDDGNPFVGTLDGQGHTISGVYINKTGGSCGLFGSTGAGQTTTIKNLIITNSYYQSDSSGEAGAIVGQTSGGTTYIDCVFVTDSVTIKSAGTSNGGFVGHCGNNYYGDPTLYMYNCVNGATVDAGSNQYVGGLIGNGNGKQLYINNCLNYGTVIGGTNYLAGFVGRDDNAGSEFNNCVNIGTIVPSSGTNYRQIVMSNSSSKKPILTNCLALTTSYGKNTTNSGCAQISKDAFLSAGFLSTTNGQKLGSDWVELAYVTVIPGIKTIIKEICVPQALVYAIGAENIKTNLHSEIVSDPAPEWLLTAWENGTVSITTTQEWKEFANFINGEYSDKCTDNMNGKTVLLGDDLDFEGEDITDYIVGNTPANGFKGTFDGQGHSISGVYMKKVVADGDTVGLFGFSAAGEEATFQNLLITDSYFESEYGAVAALLAQTAGGVTYINNIYVTDSVEIVSGDYYAGGIVGHVGQNGYAFIYGTPALIVDSCVNAASVTAKGKTSVGGILGNANNKNVTITNCLNMGNVTGGSNVGGIIGNGGGSAGVEIIIDGCVNVGTITETNSSGNVAAIANLSASGTRTAVNCYYLIGTAANGVVSGTDKDIQATSLIVLGAETLPANLNGEKWIARGEANILEICIPAGVAAFAPAETSFHKVDNTPEWLKAYADTDEFTITTVEQWKEFANFVNGAYTTGGDFEGKTVNLGADLDFAGQNMTSYIIGAWNNPFCGTFDGQGHTITGFHVEKTDADTAAIFGSTAGGKVAIIKNFIVTASHFEAKGSVGAIVGQTSGGSTEIYNVYVDADVEIVSTDFYAGGLVGYVGQNGFDFIADTPALIVDSCVNAATVTSTSNYVGGIVGNASNRNVTITNCLNMGDITGNKDVGGIIGYGAGSAAVEIIVDSCVNIGTITKTNSSGNVAAIANLSASGTRTAVNCYYLIGSAANGVVSGTYTDVRAVSISVIGGETLPENFDSEKWIARGEANILEICIPAGVAAFAPAETIFRMEDNTPDWLKDYADTDEFTIGSVDQWKEFANFVNGSYTKSGDFEGKTVYLGDDLDFENQDMVEYIVGSFKNPFAGTFDGQGHTISGVYMKKTNADGDTVGLFGLTAGGKYAMIQNLLITDSYFESEAGAVAALVAQTAGGSTIIKNIYITDSVSIISANSYVGGLVGHVGQNGYAFIDGTPALIVDSCVNAAEVTAEGYNIGGILGNANNKNVTITNCLNMGDITGNKDVGGIIGYGAGRTDVEMIVDACVNIGTITNASGNVAAIANFSDYGTRTAVNCYYLKGTAANGVVSGTDNDVQMVSFSALGGEELPDNLDATKWIVRGTSEYYEICIPAGVAAFAPEVTKYRMARGLTYIATFVADGQLVAEIPFTVEEMTVNEPKVPEKEGYIGAWEPYTLEACDITINAVYEEIIVTNPGIGLAYTSNGDGTCYVSGIGTCEDTDIIIPTVSPDGDTVTSIGWDAFYNCSSLTSIEIPASVTRIINYAFVLCSSLKSVTFAENSNLAIIGENAFDGCSSLTSIEIPASVTSIGAWAFAGCSSLTSIEIPASVTSIGWGTFSYCNLLTSITVAEGNTVYHSAGNCLIETASKTLIVGCKNSVIPTDGSVTSIGNYAFDGRGLTSIEIPASVTSIGDCAFAGCSSLTSIEIPSSVTSIGDYAFFVCSSLTSIEIPASVTSIGYSAFCDCSSLTSIEIPASVTSIGDCAFAGCSSLEKIIFLGTEEEWNAIEKGKGWNANAGIYTITFVTPEEEWTNIY